MRSILEGPVRGVDVAAADAAEASAATWRAEGPSVGAGANGCSEIAASAEVEETAGPGPPDPGPPDPIDGRFASTLLGVTLQASISKLK